MSEHFFLSQYPVEARLRSHVLSSVGKLRHDLLRRAVAELFAVGDIYNLLSFSSVKAMGRRTMRSVSSVFLSLLLAPSNDRPAAEPDDLGCRLEARSSSDGFVDEPQHYFSFFRGVLSSSSPQIDRAFFFRTSRAAVSARALSLRASSCLSFLISLLSGFFFSAFLPEVLP